MERVLDRWHQVGWDSQNSNDVEFSKEKTLRNSWKIWVFFGYAFEFSVGVFVGLAISNCSRQLLHNNGNQHFIFLQQHRKSYIHIYSRYPPWNQQDPWKLVLGKPSFLFGVFMPIFGAFAVGFGGSGCANWLFFSNLGIPSSASNHIRHVASTILRWGVFTYECIVLSISEKIHIKLLHMNTNMKQKNDGIQNGNSLPGGAEFSWWLIVGLAWWFGFIGSPQRRGIVT